MTNYTGDRCSSGWMNEMYGYSFCAPELNLRHIIKTDILIYPGYIPEPGVKYRVFHYGLRFGVGNWSFDKTVWRNTDKVNTCWAKYPEPPDPSIISEADGEDNQERDLLSIEYGKALNKALFLHHQRRKCPSLDSITKINTPEGFHPSRKIFVPTDAYNSSSVLGLRNEQKSTWVWMIGLWALSVLGLLAIISMGLSRHKQEGLRIKARHKKFDVGFF